MQDCKDCGVPVKKITGHFCEDCYALRCHRWHGSVISALSVGRRKRETVSRFQRAVFGKLEGQTK